MGSNIDEQLRILSNESKSKDETDEKRTSLPQETIPLLASERLRAEIDKLNEDIENLKQDREQRKVFSLRIFSFICLYMFAAMTIVFLCGFGLMRLSDAVIITLLTTTLAAVIGIFNFVVKYLFWHKQ